MRFTNVEDITWWIDQVTSDQRHFAGPRWLRPFHFAVISGYVHRQRLTTITVPNRLEGYAARMHLWQAIGLPCPRSITERDPAGRFHPLTPIRTENDANQAAEDICQLFEAFGTTDPTLKSVDTVLCEIAGNCFFHSDAPDIRGLVCAQAWPGGKLAQLVIADGGVGIRASLGRNPEHHERLAVTNAIELATEWGVTGDPDGHSGFGLTLARQLMEMHQGNFVVVSGQEAFCARAHDAYRYNLPQGWPGTIVVLEWKTDRPLNTTPVYRSWPGSQHELP